MNNDITQLVRVNGEIFHSRKYNERGLICENQSQFPKRLGVYPHDSGRFPIVEWSHLNFLEVVMLNMNRWAFFWQWVTAVTVSMIVAVMGAFVFMWSVGEIVQEAWGDVAMAIVVGAIFGGLIGLGVGLGQAIVLRSHGIPFGRWLGQTVLAGAVGVSIGFTLYFSLFDPENTPEILAGVLIVLSLGLPVGFAQSQLLKPQVAQAQLWVPICIVALFIGFAVGLPISGEGREWLSIGVVAVLTAVLSGAGMVWLARGGETAVAA